MIYFNALYHFFLILFKRERQTIPNYNNKIIFIDNKFENYAEQLKVFLDTGFLSSNETVFVCKFYFKNFSKIKKITENYGIKTIFFLNINQIPKLDNKIIYYPYNGQINCRLILNRKAKHIFIAHGESNKKASINRMLRLYDQVFVPGQLAVDRLVEYEILNTSDINSEKVFFSNTKLIADFYNKSIDKNGDPYLAYLPTWEGGNEEENYSTICNKNIGYFLLSISKKFGLKKILIKPHPNTGGRKIDYKRNLIKIVLELEKNGLEVRLENNSNFFDKKTEDIKIFLGVTDVSAAEFMLLAKKIPSITLIKEGKDIYAPSKYYEIKDRFILNINNETEIEDFINFEFDEIYLSEKTDSLYKYSFEYISR